MFKDAVIVLAGAVIALPIASQTLPDLVSRLSAAPQAYSAPAERYQAIEVHLADLVKQRDAQWQSLSAQNYSRRQSRSERLQRLLDASVEVLAAGRPMQARRALSALDDQIRARKADVARMRAAAANTPATACDSSNRSLLQSVSCNVRPEGQAALQSDIGQAERHLAELETDRNRKLADLAQSLREIGIDLTAADLNGLLLLVSADRMIEAYAAYQGLVQVNAALIRAAEAARGDIEVLKRYYGFHVALVEVALHLHETFLDELETLWIPRLAALRDEATTTRNQAERLIGKESDEDLRRRLAANLAANAVSIQAADLYADHLRAQAQQVAERWGELRRQHQVAVNTYRTVAIQGDVLAVMRQADNGFAELMRLELPPLRSFDSDQLRDAVGHLSEKLRLSAAP